MADWDYGGAYLRHDMSGVIELPNNSFLKVHDITHRLPQFMQRADTLFIDPPCSTGNLRSFHTKADQDLPYTFSDFEQALFNNIDIIRPCQLFMELFRSNKEAFTARLQERFEYVRTYDSFYYNKPKNACWIAHASNEPLPDLPIGGIDETKAIVWLCKHLPFGCIGDLCMGRGTVGKYAYLNGRSFVGTELNKKRLAVLVDFIAADLMRNAETPPAGCKKVAA